MNKLYSNEIVFRGHPDKVCDQISNAILDYCLQNDINSRCGIETCGGKGKIFITGEITTKAPLNKFIIKKITKRVLKDIGYKTNYKIIVNISNQSHDIALGVDDGGAGDQGMMFGYACNDNKRFLPTAMVILQDFAQFYDNWRKDNETIKPDGKAQITGLYDDNFKLLKIAKAVVSYQNDEKHRDTNDAIIENKLKELATKYKVDIDENAIYINPTGKFEIGGFEGDAGLTGRKIVVDAYQSFANVGGGCMNGKDPSKVDLSGAYKAREIAVKLLKQRRLKWCEVQLSYAIGRETPLAIYINSNRGVILPYKALYEECTPNNIIKDLKLKEINYEEKAQFGHFR